MLIMGVIEGGVPLLNEAGVDDLGENGVHFAFQDVSNNTGFNGAPHFLAGELTNLLINKLGHGFYECKFLLSFWTYWRTNSVPRCSVNLYP